MMTLVKPARVSARRRWVIGGFGVVLFAAVIVSVVVGTRLVIPGDPRDAAQVTRGAAVYAARCATCHGVNLEGQANWQQELPTGGRPAPPHDASGHTWHHNDQALFAIIKEGGQPFSPPGYVNRMPAFGAQLTDDEIWAVLAFIKSRWSLEIQALQRQGHQ